MGGSSRRQDSPKIAAKEKIKISRAQKKPGGGIFEAIFAEIRNPLVPLSSRRRDPEEEIRNQETLTPRPPLSKPKRVSVRRREQKEEKKANPLFYLLAPIAAVFLWFGFQGNVGQQSVSDSANQVENEGGIGNLNERVEFYRRTVGRQINRERIGTEYANQTSAPRIPHGAKKTNGPDMLTGVPLAVEQHHRVSSRDRAELANPDYSDNRVAYRLREQAQMNESERKAQRQYVEEFIANAAKAGYRVSVDKNGNVKVHGRGPATGSPSLQLPSGPSATGSMQ